MKACISTDFPHRRIPVMIFMSGVPLRETRANSVQICNKAIDKLLITAKPEEVDEDWAELYREYSGIISNEDAQEIWAIILAQECNEPGSMPKALLNIMLSIERQEAEDFTHLASFCLTIDGEKHPLIIL